MHDFVVVLVGIGRYLYDVSMCRLDCECCLILHICDWCGQVFICDVNVF